MEANEEAWMKSSYSRERHGGDLLRETAEEEEKGEKDDRTKRKQDVDDNRGGGTDRERKTLIERRWRDHVTGELEENGKEPSIFQKDGREEQEATREQDMEGLDLLILTEECLDLRASYQFLEEGNPSACFLSMFLGCTRVSSSSSSHSSASSLPNSSSSSSFAAVPPSLRSSSSCGSSTHEVEALELECYVEMARRSLASIAKLVRQTFPHHIHNIVLAHRYGYIPLAETVLLVGISSSHPSESQDACALAVELVKHHLPIWKEEILIPHSRDEEEEGEIEEERYQESEEEKVKEEDNEVEKARRLGDHVPCIEEYELSSILGCMDSIEISRKPITDVPSLINSVRSPVCGAISVFIQRKRFCSSSLVSRSMTKESRRLSHHKSPDPRWASHNEPSLVGVSGMHAKTLQPSHSSLTHRQDSLLNSSSTPRSFSSSASSSISPSSSATGSTLDVSLGEHIGQCREERKDGEEVKIESSKEAMDQMCTSIRIKFPHVKKMALRVFRETDGDRECLDDPVFVACVSAPHRTDSREACSLLVAKYTENISSFRTEEEISVLRRNGAQGEEEEREARLLISQNLRNRQSKQPQKERRRRRVQGALLQPLPHIIQIEKANNCVQESRLSL
ncbi:molybdopterin converting subunit 2 protein [Cystoisospora suis]|uniref:Molybdopterin converting subunit 2 protein n=1 Tax=Cystoisospora suis TaxID=483139 RepID=A0A2C6K1G5_9APIC|nr:molybdopterin converting subunit 2 protein [Cystoisospora suis]